MRGVRKPDFHRMTRAGALYRMMNNRALLDDVADGKPVAAPSFCKLRAFSV